MSPKANGISQYGIMSRDNCVPSKAAVAAITSYAEKDEDATVSVDVQALGFTDGCIVTNAEGGAELPLRNGTISIPLQKHDLIVLRLSPKGSQ